MNHLDQYPFDDVIDKDLFCKFVVAGLGTPILIRSFGSTAEYKAVIAECTY